MANSAGNTHTLKVCDYVSFKEGRQSALLEDAKGFAAQCNLCMHPYGGYHAVSVILQCNMLMVLLMLHCI